MIEDVLWSLISEISAAIVSASGRSRLICVLRWVWLCSAIATIALFVILSFVIRNDVVAVLAGIFFASSAVSLTAMGIATLSDTRKRNKDGKEKPKGPTD